MELRAGSSAQTDTAAIGMSGRADLLSLALQPQNSQAKSKSRNPYFLLDEKGECAGISQDKKSNVSKRIGNGNLQRLIFFTNSNSPKNQPNFFSLWDVCVEIAFVK